VFKTDHSEQLSLHDGYRVADVALASSAAPTYFPVVELLAPSSGAVERFCDGGIFANHPALLGYVEAASELHIDPARIDLLSVSTGRRHEESSAGGGAGVDRGGLGWGDLIAAVVGDSSSGIADETLKRITRQPLGDGARYVRVEIRSPDGTTIDKVTPATTHALRAAGTDRASDRELRRQVGELFA
jgi:hypothetical protein